MTSPKTARLATELEAALRGIRGVRAVYVFGSATVSAKPEDVDLVLVYGPPLAPDTAPEVSPLVEGAVSRVFALPTHLMFFSEREAREPGLLAGLNPSCLLYGEPVPAEPEQP